MFNIGRNSALLAGAGLTLVNRGLLRAGLRRRVDGWRRATGIVLRGEESTFVLSAFGLDAWSDRPDGSRRDASAEAHIAERLRRFLSVQPECLVAVRRGEHEDRRERVSSPHCTLGFEPFIDGPGRFVAPTSWTGTAHGARDSGLAPLINVVCRVSPRSGVDVWARFNHVATDGVPVQEMMSRLEAEWGAIESVSYPTSEEFRPFIRVRPLGLAPPARGGLGEIQFFADFGRLQAWRQRVNATLPSPLSLGAAILWRLGSLPVSGEFHFGTTVDVEARDGLERGVGVVVVRPADFFRRRDGLARYAAAFNDALEQARRRESSATKTLDGAALIPASMARRVLRHGLKHHPGAFGEVGLTIIRGARVFGAPIAEAGHANGFIAIGSVALPTTDGRRVGCVTVKGMADAIVYAPEHFRQALDVPERAWAVGA